MALAIEAIKFKYNRINVSRGRRYYNLIEIDR
jgi:hypothetical protein